MSFYRHHVFTCTHERDPGHPKPSCGRRGGIDLRAWTRNRVEELGLTDVRMNAAGCLGLCPAGPVMVVYPSGTWYAPRTAEDAERIIQEHLVNDRPVEDLALQPPE